MNAALISAVVSGLVSLSTIFMSDKVGRRRDRESDWRKLKLDQYKEFTSALSNAVHRTREEVAQRRYADAVNNLSLIAPAKVLKLLYAFQEESSYRNESMSLDSYNRSLSNLLREMRRDCQPEDPKDDPDFLFTMMNIPPSTKS